MGKRACLMPGVLIGKEPNPTSPAVRDFKRNPGFRVVYSNLVELREAMVQDDIVLVDSLAKRKLRAQAAQEEHVATTGKRRSYNVTNWLPSIYREAQRRHPREEGLLDVLERTYPFIATIDSAYQLYDFPIIDAVAARLNKAKQATVFKRDRAEGLAPATQAGNIARAVTLAEKRLPEDTEFAEQVERVYRALVPATVAVQQAMFDRTYLLDDWDGVGFRGIDLAS